MSVTIVCATSRDRLHLLQACTKLTKVFDRPPSVADIMIAGKAAWISLGNSSSTFESQVVKAAFSPMHRMHTYSFARTKKLAFRSNMRLTTHWRSVTSTPSHFGHRICSDARNDCGIQTNTLGK